MAVLPAPYGQADWQNFVDYWRDEDATWLQERVILRYANAADRSSQIGDTPGFGRVTYNEEVDRLEVYSRQRTAWIPVLQVLNLTATKDDTQGVALSHREAGGKGVTLTPTEILLDNPLNVMSGVLKVDSTGVTIKTGVAAAKITTSDVALVSDKPMALPVTATQPGLIFSGTTDATAIATGNRHIDVGTGRLTAANITLSGTLAGGAASVLNASKATIGGVKVGITPNVVEASSGFVSQAGIFYGGTTSAVMRQRDTVSPFALGTSYVQVTDVEVIINGGTTRLLNTIRIENNTAPIRNMVWQGTGADAYMGPVIVSATDPGAANYPRGTIWAKP
jgi:hypothetical protein